MSNVVVAVVVLIKPLVGTRVEESRVGGVGRGWQGLAEVDRVTSQGSLCIYLSIHALNYSPSPLAVPPPAPIPVTVHNLTCAGPYNLWTHLPLPSCYRRVYLQNC
ncbi:hypothetical protein E2C01_064703 [Portunus trituberculatus]|uniref:Secreted protein n=1 Tax=Portunus trituberculatus TaxID=210409 RepID=A0A5B7HPH9_PORTR|nr:hypothetical protein [Portunus trituberculatus]